MDFNYVDACTRIKKPLPVGELLNILNLYPVLRDKALTVSDCVPSDPAVLRTLVGEERSLVRTRARRLVKGAPLIALARCAPLAETVEASVAAVFFTEVFERLRERGSREIDAITVRARGVLAEVAAGHVLPPSWIPIAVNLGIMRPKLEKPSIHAPAFALRALRITRNAEFDITHSDSILSIQWSYAMEFPLNMIIAMFAIRPEYILDLVPVEIVVNAIVLELQDCQTQVMFKLKTIFLFLIAHRLTGVVQLRPLPNLSWNTENMFAAEQFSSKLQTYIQPVTLSLCFVGVPDFVELFSRIFEIATVLEDRRLVELFITALEDVPSLLLRKVLMRFFASDDVTIPKLQSVCNVVHMLASELSSVREAFLQLLALHDCFILYILKAIHNSNSRSIVDLVCFICDMGIGIAKQEPNDELCDTALNTIERVLAWISVRFRVDIETVWCPVWKKFRSIRARCKPMGRGVHICYCMAVEIVESTHRKFRIGKCSCRSIRYHKTLLPSLEQWSFWECLTENYLPTDSNVLEVQVWIAWCHVAALENRPEWLQLFRGSIRYCLSISIAETGSNIQFLSGTIRCVSKLLGGKSWSRPISTVFTVLSEEISNACSMWSIGDKGDSDEVELLRRYRIMAKQCVEQSLMTIPRRLRFPESITQPELEKANLFVPIFFSEMEEIEKCSMDFPCLTEYAGHVGVLANLKAGKLLPLLKLLGALANAQVSRKVKAQSKTDRDKLKARIMGVFGCYET